MQITSYERIMKKPSKKSKKSINRKLLSEWSVKVRNLYDNKCAVCKSTKYVQAHHLIPKERSINGSFEHKYDLNNGIAVCAMCHRFGIKSFHKNIFWAYEFMVRNEPEKLKYLKEKYSEAMYQV